MDLEEERALRAKVLEEGLSVTYYDVIGKDKRAALWARVSSRKQVQGTGLWRQTENNRRYAAELGWEVAVEYAGYESAWAAEEAEDRPMVAAMMADARAGKFDGIFFESCDRLFRNAVHHELVYREMHHDLGIMWFESDQEHRETMDLIIDMARGFR